MAMAEVTVQFGPWMIGTEFEETSQVGQLFLLSGAIPALHSVLISSRLFAVCLFLDDLVNNIMNEAWEIGRMMVVGTGHFRCLFGLALKGDVFGKEVA